MKEGLQPSNDKTRSTPLDTTGVDASRRYGFYGVLLPLEPFRHERSLRMSFFKLELLPVWRYCRTACYLLAVRCWFEKKRKEEDKLAEGQHESSFWMPVFKRLAGTFCCSFFTFPSFAHFLPNTWLSLRQLPPTPPAWASTLQLLLPTP